MKLPDTTDMISATRFDIFYMKPDFHRDGLMGYDFAVKQGHKFGFDLSATHTELKSLDYAEPVNLDRVYHDMQGEVWSPDGQARDLIRAKGLQHTSMSVGDIIHVPGQNGGVFMVDRYGFKRIEMETVAGPRPLNKYDRMVLAFMTKHGHHYETRFNAANAAGNFADAEEILQDAITRYDDWASDRDD